MLHRTSTLAFATILLAACGGTDADQAAQQTPELVITGNDSAAQATSLYQMPTPNELFAIVRKLDGRGQKSALSSAPDADRFATLQGRALNFGVYATDMVYASNFGLTSEVVRYYLACKKLGDQLGLVNSFSTDVQRRLEKNLTHGDSLEVLTNDTYYGAYQKLQDEKMGPVLVLVLAGGWVESMHLVMGKVEAFDEKSELVARVAEQKASLEQLLDMMGTVKGEDASLAQTQEKLAAIRAIFDKAAVVRTPSNGPSPSGRMVLGDHVSVTLTSDQFNEIKTAVEDLRNTITRAEDDRSHT